MTTCAGFHLNGGASGCRGVPPPPTAFAALLSTTAAAWKMRYQSRTMAELLLALVSPKPQSAWN